MDIIWHTDKGCLQVVDGPYLKSLTEAAHFLSCWQEQAGSTIMNINGFNFATVARAVEFLKGVLDYFEVPLDAEVRRGSPRG